MMDESQNQPLTPEAVQPDPQMVSTVTAAVLQTLQATYPDLKTKIFGAMQRLPLPEWGPEHPPRSRKPVNGGE